MINKRKLFISITVSLALIFTLTYCIADRYFMNKRNAENKNTTVAAQNIDNNIKDDMKICLKSGDKTDDELSLKELKGKFNLDSDITMSTLCSALKEKGYELEGTENSEMIFKREASKSVNPDKYYIGEKEGYLAIFKSDENGNIFLEKDSDVYRDNKKVEMLPQEDQTKIKNYEMEYDTKEEAEEDLSEFLS